FQPGPEPVPAGKDGAALDPGEHPRNGAQALQARRTAGFAGTTVREWTTFLPRPVALPRVLRLGAEDRSRGHRQAADVRDRRGLGEEAPEVGVVVDQRPIGGAGL